jgi:hypothetical protein
LLNFHLEKAEFGKAGILLLCCLSMELTLTTLLTLGEEVNDQTVKKKRGVKEALVLFSCDSLLKAFFCFLSLLFFFFFTRQLPPHRKLPTVFLYYSVLAFGKVNR